MKAATAASSFRYRYHLDRLAWMDELIADHRVRRALDGRRCVFLALAESQIEAVCVALATKVLVITGGPGYGSG